MAPRAAPGAADPGFKPTGVCATYAAAMADASIARTAWCALENARSPPRAQPVILRGRAPCWQAHPC